MGQSGHCSHNHIQPRSLSSLCEEYFIKYMHNVVWRQLDPPKNHDYDCVCQDECSLHCRHLPETRSGPTEAPEFRENLTKLRNFLGENLVRHVHDDLAKRCGRFVNENKIKYGDVLLYLIFQDKYSTSLKLTAKHIVCRKWKTREKNSLIRTLCEGERLVKLALPGKVNDSMMFVIAKHCRLLEELDISNSYITEKGILAIGGVVLKYNSITELKANKVNFFCTKNGHKMLKVDDDTKKLRSGKEFGCKTIRITMEEKEEEDLSFISSKMKPFLEKRLGVPGAEQLCWISEGSLYKYKEDFGCLKLKRLDIDGTNFPKGGLCDDNVGVKRDSVLTLLILLEELLELVWPDLGSVIQTYQKISEELCSPKELDKMKLKLAHFLDINTTLDSLHSAVEFCPNISKIDLSMYNFSSFHNEDDMDTGYDSSVTEKKYWLNTIFSFQHLRDFETQFMDDSPLFKLKMRNFGFKLTRICMNKMISISFPTIVTIKTCCTSLKVLEVHVDEITNGSSLPLEQVIRESPNGRLESLEVLRLGGAIPTGDVLKYLVTGCPSLKKLCCIFFNYRIIKCNCFIKDLMDINPLQDLEVFCFERCFLNESTFFYLINKLPKIKYIGNMEEWTMDKRARARVNTFVKDNNIDVDVTSLKHSSYNVM